MDAISIILDDLSAAYSTLLIHQGAELPVRSHYSRFVALWCGYCGNPRIVWSFSKWLQH
jgi:hypothetical protein